MRRVRAEGKVGVGYELLAGQRQILGERESVKKKEQLIAILLTNYFDLGQIKFPSSSCLELRVGWSVSVLGRWLDAAILKPPVGLLPGLHDHAMYEFQQ